MQRHHAYRCFAGKRNRPHGHRSPTSETSAGDNRKRRRPARKKATVSATIDRRQALKGADYVITTFQQGGLDAYKLDIEIPRRFGVEQCVGDTLTTAVCTLPQIHAMVTEMLAAEKQWLPQFDIKD